jgi:fatty acid desaturase
VDEIFDRENLISADTLAVLMTRNDVASGRRLLAHLSCIAGALLVAAATPGTPWVVLPTLALAFFLGTLFAPFHECTHSTAFATPAYNRFGVALTGVLFGTSWHAYRDFHYQHHAHTQDPAKDPEIMMDPNNLGPWPRTPLRWLMTLTGARFFVVKIIGMMSCWIPGPRTRFANQPARVRTETQITSAFWLIVLLAAASGAPGALPLIVAFVLAHAVQGVWLTTEHSGRAEDGSILERTRTIGSNALVRFFIWNMNYHCEHHGWPGVPWHALPTLHQHLGVHVDTQPGYLQVYRAAFGGARWSGL